MNDFKKLVRLGKSPDGHVFCTIEFKDSKLSITGVIGPTRFGNCKGSCGQIIMSPFYITDYAEGWDAETELKFGTIWNDHHLNDMNAGSPDQTAFLKGVAKRDYKSDCAALEAAGLQPDPNYLVDGKPYSYGSKWLKTEVPQDALDFLQSLPDSDKAMPGVWA